MRSLLLVAAIVSVGCASPGDLAFSTELVDFGQTLPGVERTEPVGYGTAAGTPLAGTGTPVSDPVYPARADRPTNPATTGLPNPAGSVADDTSWLDTRAPGGLS